MESQRPGEISEQDENKGVTMEIQRKTGEISVSDLQNHQFNLIMEIT